MAYMNQEKKTQINALLKQAIPIDWKWSLAVRNYSTIILTISSAPVDLVAEYVAARCSDEVRRDCIANRYVDVNPYYWQEHFTGELLDIFTKVFAALNLNNHDHSDIQSDYFDVGHYVQVNIGKWDKPFNAVIARVKGEKPDDVLPVDGNWYGIIAPDED